MLQFLSHLGNGFIQRTISFSQVYSIFVVWFMSSTTCNISTTLIVHVRPIPLFRMKLLQRMLFSLRSTPIYLCFSTCSYEHVASSPGHSQILSRSCRENREKAWDQNYAKLRHRPEMVDSVCTNRTMQNYVTDRKWWTRLVCNVDSVCTNRVHHFRSVT